MSKLPEVCPKCCAAAIKARTARKGYLCQACIDPLFGEEKGDDRKATNGDTMRELRDRLLAVNATFDASMVEHRKLQQAFLESTQRMDGLKSELLNIRTRIEIWHQQFPK